MAKKQGGRLLSSAGLVNYYESEDRRAIHISPITVMAVVSSNWHHHSGPEYGIRINALFLFLTDISVIFTGPLLFIQGTIPRIYYRFFHESGSI